MRSSVIVFLVLMLSAVAVTGQPGPLKPVNVQVADTTFNHLKYFGDTVNFKKLYEKFDRLYFEGQGKINVVHMGGSHVQADMWTDQFRQHMQQVLPGTNGGRGFLFPFTMAGTNNPSGYKVEYTGTWSRCRNVIRDTSCTLGLAGIAVTTSDTLSSVRITFRESQSHYSFSRIKIFHPDDSTFTIAFPSDSIITSWRDDEAGFTEFILPYEQDTLFVQFVKTDSLQKYFTIYGFSLESDDPGVILNSVGVNGASVPDYNRCQLLPAHLSAIRPDLIIFSVGINDAYAADFSRDKYMADYDTLISKIRSVAPDVAILFTTNTDSYVRRRYPNRNAFEVREAMEMLSAKHNAAVWDLFGVMGGLKSIRTWEYRGLAQRDRIHLKREGYQLLGNLMFNALIKSYGDYLAGN